MPSIVFRFIKPKRDYRTLGGKIMQQLADKLEEDAAGIQADYEATVESWDHPVEFETRFFTQGGARVAYVYTDDEIYKFVDFGTQPHVIMAKSRFKPLTFQSGYRAKTTPGVIGSHGGGPFGDVVRGLIVHHPGTEARRFSETIQQKWQKDMPAGMQETVRQVTESV